MTLSLGYKHNYPHMEHKFFPEKNADMNSIYACIQNFKQQGIDHRSQGKYSEAKKAFVNAREMAEKHQELGMLHARILHELAFTEEMQGHWSHAEALYKQCLNLEEKLDDILGKGATLYQLAHLKSSQQQTDDAIKIYQQAFEAQKASKDVSGQAATLHQLAYLSVQQNNVSDAIDYYERLREIDAVSGDQRAQAVALYQMGELLAEQGEFDSALAAYQASLNITTEEDSASKAVTLTQIARLEQQRGNLEQASVICRKALALVEKLSNDEAQTLQATIIYCLGDIVADLGKIDDALAFYQQALPLDNEPYGRAATLTAIGRLLAEQKQDFAQSLRCLRQALKILEKIGSSDEMEYVRTLITSVKQATT